MYYLENVELTKCMTFEHSRYKPKLARERLSWHIKNLDTFQSHLDCRGYSCHQWLPSIWYNINHMMRLMEWWCIFLKAKHGNTLTVCILTFHLNQGTCVLDYVQTDSTYSSHLLLLILVDRSYSQFITCHWGCVWGWSSCFYLWWYLIRAVRVGI